MTDDDEAVARRIQQELEDAEYAHAIGLREREEAASREVVLSLERQNHLDAEHAARLRGEGGEPATGVRKWWPLATCLVCAIVVPLLFVFDVFDSSGVPFFGDLFGNDWIGNDPWSGNNNMTIDVINGTAVPRLGRDAFGWANTGNGLLLDVLNACTDPWQPFVQEAIANWDDGSPIDSLTLFSSRIDPEPGCSTATGKLKICNG